jgi:arabinofuranosyltransferase
LRSRASAVTSHLFRTRGDKSSPRSSPDVADRAESRRPKISRTVVAGTIVFLLAWADFLVVARVYGRGTMNGHPYWALHDDFLISERYARNLLRGDGLVFNRGERVEGFSDPLMVLAVCTPLEALGVKPDHLGLTVAAVNGIAHALIALVLFARFGGETGRFKLGLVLALAYLTLPHHAFHARSGLEVYWQALFLLIVLARLRSGGLLFYVALAALPLVHSIDLPLWAGAVVARLWLERHRLLSELRPIAASTLPLVAYFAFRFAYYHQLFPNTYYLKSAGVSAPVLGLRYLLHAAAWMLPVLAVLAVVLVVAKRRATLPAAALAILVPYLAFVAKVGGDNFAWYRFVLAIVPALLLLAGDLAREGPRRREGLVAAGVAAQIAVNAFGYVHAHADMLKLRDWDERMAAIGEALHDNTRPEQTVALFAAGHAAYLSDRPVIDMLGKSDPHIARLSPNMSRRVGHQKDDPAYVLALHPDFVEMPYTSDALADQDQLRADQKSRWGYFADLALEPEFVRDYAPVRSASGEIPIYARRELGPQHWGVPAELTAR